MLLSLKKIFFLITLFLSFSTAYSLEVDSVHHPIVKETIKETKEAFISSFEKQVKLGIDLTQKIKCFSTSTDDKTRTFLLTEISKLEGNINENADAIANFYEILFNLNEFETSNLSHFMKLLALEVCKAYDFHRRVLNKSIFGDDDLGEIENYKKQFTDQFSGSLLTLLLGFYEANLLKLGPNKLIDLLSRLSSSYYYLDFHTSKNRSLFQKGDISDCLALARKIGEHLFSRLNEQLIPLEINIK